VRYCAPEQMLQQVWPQQPLSGPAAAALQLRGLSVAPPRAVRR
jgi:hypothetical protein